MLDSIEPGDLDQWLAFRELEPDVCELIRRLTETVKLGFSMLCAIQGAEVTPEDFDFGPRKEDGELKTASDGEMTPQQAAAVMTAHMGPADGK